MAVDITMPRLGLTMEEGTIVRWHAAGGDPVLAQGQVLLDVETDKVTIEVEAPATGVMGSVLVNEGQKVPVGTLLGGSSPRTRFFAPLRMTAPRRASKRRLRSCICCWHGAWPSKPVSMWYRLGAGYAGRPDHRWRCAGCAGEHSVAEAGAGHLARTRIFSSPRARKQARALGVDWRVVPGSGPHGRVIERYVLNSGAHLLQSFLHGWKKCAGKPRPWRSGSPQSG